MNHSEKPLVSVIITTYHNEEYLPRAIDSILHQNYPEIELIVVDDNPPESDARLATEKVMKQYPQAVYLKHPENRNGAAARNTGIKVAKGRYISFLDNDDFYFSNHISCCVEALEKHPECGCVLCGVVKICEGLCWDMIPAPNGDLIRRLLFSETALGTGSNLFVKSDVVKKIKGFDESFLRHQDLEFGVRLFLESRAVSLDEVQIVKEMEGFSNAPDFDRFLKTKQHFWDKFQYIINSLTEDEQKCYYAGQYSALLYTACKGGNKQQVRQAVSQLEQYRKLNKKEVLLVALSKVHLFHVYEGMKKIIKYQKSDRIYKEAAKNLTNYDLQVFRQALSVKKRG